MNETQNEYETEHETDAEPDFSHIHAPWHLESSDGLDDVSEGYLAVVNENDGLVGYAWEDDAPIITAAGTAAQEAREMGYDPQKAVEALPVGLEQARCAIIDLLDGPPGETSAPAVKSAIKRLAFFLGEASNEEVSEIVDDKMLNDALASAEGSDSE
jgi:hypothetical protein